MKADELMVGDWVLLFDKTPAKVDCIGNVEVYLTEPRGQHELNWRVTYEHIKPIQITPEILEKNGFQCRELGCRSLVTRFVNIRIKRTDKWHIIIRKKDEKGKSEQISYYRDWAENVYVHELQQALRLCRIDKEIVV